MRSLRSSLTSVGLLSSLATIALAASAPLGCSSSASDGAEAAARGAEALTTNRVYGVVPLATDVSVALSFNRTGSYAAQATLTGPGLSATASEPPPTKLGPGGATVHAISFAGLRPCTAYAYTLSVAGAPPLSGSIHTTAPGGAACGAGEDLRPTGAQTFRGVMHQRFDHSWCTYDDWDDRWRSYPQGVAYASIEGTTADRVRLGVQHSYSGGTDPFPCGEQFVQVWRAQLKFTVQPWQAARATGARFTAASAASFDANGPRSGLCTSNLAHVERVRYVANQDTTQKNDFGFGWSGVLGPGEDAPWGLMFQSPAEAVWLDAGGAVTASVFNDVSPAATAGGPTDIAIGLADPGDGFGELDGSNPQFAQDNDVCFTDLTGPVVHLDYAPLAPNTPSNCQATFACATGMTVTCDGTEGNALALHRVYSANDDTVVATGTGAVTYGDYGYVSAPTYYVCASNAAGTACSEPLTLPAVSSCGDGNTHGGSGSGGSGGGSPKCNGLKFCRQ